MIIPTCSTAILLWASSTAASSSLDNGVKAFMEQGEAYMMNSTHGLHDSVRNLIEIRNKVIHTHGLSESAFIKRHLKIAAKEASSNECKKPDGLKHEFVDLSDWMAQIKSKDVRLNEVTLPGSHDAGASHLTTNFNQADPAYQVIKKATDVVDLPESMFASFVCKFALTQGLSIADQLKAGVRYLDLRVDWDPERRAFYTFHLLFGDKIDTVLADINNFLLINEEEIIIVEMTNMFSTSVTDEEKLNLQSMIVNTFGPLLYRFNGENPATKSIADCVKDGSRLLFTIQDKLIRDHPNLWPNEIIKNTYANSPRLENMIEYNIEQLESLGNMKDDQLFHKTSWTLTPNAGYISRNVLSGGLYNLAISANNALFNFALEEDISDWGQIVIIDFVNRSPLMEVLSIPGAGDLDAYEKVHRDNTFWGNMKDKFRSFFKKIHGLFV